MVLLVSSCLVYYDTTQKREIWRDKAVRRTRSREVIAFELATFRASEMFLHGPWAMLQPVYHVHKHHRILI